MADRWDGEQAEIVVSVTRMVNATFEVVYRLDAQDAADVMGGGPCQSDPTHTSAAPAGWEDDGMTQEELDGADDAIREALVALAAKDPAFKAALDEVSDG